MILILTVAGTADAQTVISKTDAVQHFLEMAYSDNPNIRLTYRWKKPVSVVIVGKHTDTHEQMIEDYLRRIKELTGLTITRSISKNGNLAIVFSESADTFLDKYSKQLRSVTGSENEYKNIIQKIKIKKFPCFNKYSSHDGAMTIAFIFVSNKLAEKYAKNCIGANLSIVLGLYYEASGRVPSIRRWKVESAELSVYDLLALKTLYHPRLETSMTAVQAKGIATEIIGDLIDRKEWERWEKQLPHSRFTLRPRMYIDE